MYICIKARGDLRAELLAHHPAEEHSVEARVVLLHDRLY